MKKYISSLIIATCLASASFGGTIDCGYQTIKNLYVQGERSQPSFHGNKLLIIMGDDKKAECSDTTFAYLDIDDPAFNGTLSMALAAYMASKKIRIVINDGPLVSNARRIEFINL